MRTLYVLLARFLLIGLAAAGWTASAAPLSGSVSSVGTLCLGSSPTTPTPVCTHQDVSALTYFDFINGGIGGLMPSPGTPGSLLFLTAQGDLMPLVGQVGSINDFMIPGPGDPLASFAAISPLWTVTGTDGATYTYALQSLTSIHRQNHHALDVFGQGLLCRNGADCNLFSFLFTTQDADGALRTTFSLSQSGGTPVQFDVAEPGPLALLGLGLIGLALCVRRRTN